MREGDPFEGAYGRLAATRLAAGPPGTALETPVRYDVCTPVRWATSHLLPRLQALAPSRHARRLRRPTLDD